MNARTLLGSAAAALVATAVLATPANAAPTYKQCRNADPGTKVANACERNGWVIEKEFAITPKGWAARNELGACATPATGDTNCYLDATTRTDETHEGLSELRYTRWGGYRLVQYVNGSR